MHLRRKVWFGYKNVVLRGSNKDHCFLLLFFLSMLLLCYVFEEEEKMLEKLQKW
jgi:hypothetical protein